MIELHESFFFFAQMQSKARMKKEKKEKRSFIVMISRCARLPFGRMPCRRKSIAF